MILPDEKADAEPEEFDPDEELGPDVPEVSAPTVESPEAPDPADIDVPENVAGPFWKLVAILNLALFAASLGPMLLYFRGQVLAGTGVFLLGAGSFLYAYLLYRNYKRDRNG